MMMNRILLLSVLLSLACQGFGQDRQAVIRALSFKEPSLITGNRLLAVTVWNDEASTRETLEQMEKAASVFEWAKLKGGSRGVVAVLIFRPEQESAARIFIGRENLKHIVPMSTDDLREATDIRSNAVYNSDGAVILRELPAGKIYDSIHALITR